MIDAYNRLGRTGLNELAEQEQLPSLQENPPVAKDLPSLLPGERAASLPQESFPVEPVAQLLAGVVERRFSVDSVAWSGDPIPLMRSLQKKLIEFSLGQDEAQRRPCLDAIRIVELAVSWRLRWQQMRRSELEAGETDPEAGLQSDETRQPAMEHGHETEEAA